jgi:hypothetical protein
MGNKPAKEYSSIEPSPEYPPTKSPNHSDYLEPDKKVVKKVPKTNSKEHVIYLDRKPVCILIDRDDPGEDYQHDALYSRDNAYVYTRLDDPETGETYPHKIFYKNVHFQDAINLHTSFLKEQWEEKQTKQKRKRLLQEERERDKAHTKVVNNYNQLVINYNKCHVRNSALVNENKLLRKQLNDAEKMIEFLKRLNEHGQSDNEETESDTVPDVEYKKEQVQEQTQTQVQMQVQKQVQVQVQTKAKATANKEVALFPTIPTAEIPVTAAPVIKIDEKEQLVAI